MFEKFKLWSETNPEAKKVLSPDLDVREWTDLNPHEKQRMRFYLRPFFEGSKSNRRIHCSIIALNEVHKYSSYGVNFLRDPNSETARQDFENIFLKQSEHVVFQLLSIFCRAILVERTDSPFPKSTEESEEEYKKRHTRWKYEEFDRFKEGLNDVFEQFGINVVVTRAGFVPRQDRKIIDEIYHPVLNFLSGEEWEEVNRELRDAFNDYQAKTRAGYSSTVTHAICAIEAYLQICLYGKTGKGTLSDLITKTINKGIIPNDAFSKQIFKNIESILAKERKETGDAHPKKEYATEKNARLMLNLVMTFLQHCIQNK